MDHVSISLKMTVPSHPAWWHFCLRRRKIQQKNFHFALKPTCTSFWLSSIKMIDSQSELVCLLASSATWKTGLVERGGAWKLPASCFLWQELWLHVSRDASTWCEGSLRGGTHVSSWFHNMEFNFFPHTLRPSDWSFLVLFLVDLKWEKSLKNTLGTKVFPQKKSSLSCSTVIRSIPW